MVIKSPFNYNTTEDIKTLVENDVKGIFIHLDSCNLKSNFNGLKTWVYAHLLWNPSLDTDSLVNEFIEGYYGKAAGPVREYWDLIQEAMKKSGEYYGCFFRNTEGYPEPFSMALTQTTTASWLDLCVIEKATGIMQKAERLVCNEPVILERIQALSISIEALWL